MRRAAAVLVALLVGWLEIGPASASGVKILELEPDRFQPPHETDMIAALAYLPMEWRRARGAVANLVLSKHPGAVCGETQGGRLCVVVEASASAPAERLLGLVAGVPELACGQPSAALLREFIRRHEIGHALEVDPVGGMMRREMTADAFAVLSMRAAGLPIGDLVEVLAAARAIAPLRLGVEMATAPALRAAARLLLGAAAAGSDDLAREAAQIAGELAWPEGVAAMSSGLWAQVMAGVVSAARNRPDLGALLGEARGAEARCRSWAAPAG